MPIAISRIYNRFENSVEPDQLASAYRSLGVCALISSITALNETYEPFVTSCKNLSDSMVTNLIASFHFTAYAAC